jgi:ParB-like nuclease domain/DNA methylase
MIRRSDLFGRGLPAVDLEKRHTAGAATKSRRGADSLYVGIQELFVGEVIFRDDLYPRIETDHLTVQKYAADLEVLPPIEVNQRNELIDGWHRWTAHKKKEAERIPVTVTPTTSDSHLLELAIARNAAHGLQLSQEDKCTMARRIYHLTPEREREGKKKQLAALLSVSARTVREWLSRIDKDSKEARDRRIFDLWLACRTQEEIAEAVGCSQGEVSKSIPNGNFAEWNKTDAQAAVAAHAVDFEIPLYNEWRQQEKTPGSGHFGNTEVRWVDNLLYGYTKPFDVVVDPFAGGGSTIDICKKRLRRYWVSDRRPIPEREQEIRRWDITDGLPPLPRWKDVSLVYLDPPYWKQAEGRYSHDPQDLGNMSLADFTNTLAGLVKGLAGKMTTGSHIALIIQPTQWRAPEKRYTDHAMDLRCCVKLPVCMRFQAPYETQQCTAQMVGWAKANRKFLVLTREIVVWEVA